jgi:hypothetical protein
MGDVEVQGLSLGGIIGNLQQLTSAVGALLRLLGAPFTAVWNWISVRRQLRAKLGEWSSEAARNGRWQQPVLGREAFEQHLRNTNGHFNPTGNTTSTFAWAHLLYALDIRPGSLVLQWEPLRDNFDPLKTGQLPLKIEGPVLCHILNMYRLYSDPSPQDFGEEETGSDFTLPFGTLRVSKDAGALVATFKQRNPEALKSPKEPFTYDSVYVPDGPRGPHLQFPSEQVVETYLLTLNTGISDQSCTWPDRRASFAERINGLVRNLKRLRENRWENPYLVCRSWLEEGSRIYRRVTTNDQEEPTLLRDIVDSFDANSGTKKNLQKLAPEQDNDGNDWRSRLIKILRSRCLFDREAISLVWTRGGDSTNRIDSWITVVMEENLPEILKNLRETASGIWAQEAREKSGEVAYLFNHGSVVHNCPGFALEFTSESQLWKSTLEVNC